MLDYEEPAAKGEFKAAEAIAAGKLGRGVGPVAIRRKQPIQAPQPL